jgi:outer membrane protein OmpA-like peptidoglycan-associated protein
MIKNSNQRRNDEFFLPDSAGSQRSERGRMSMMFRKSILTLVVLSVVLLPACARKNLQMDISREVHYEQPTISSVSHRLLQTPEGDNAGIVEITISGDPGLQATFDVADLAQGVPLEEAPEGGFYSGRFRIRADQAGTYPVLGRLTHPQAGTVSQLSSTPLVIKKPPPVVVVRDCSGEALRNIQSICDSAMVHFPSDSSQLLDSEKILLTRVVEEMRAEPKCRLHLEGHADRRYTEGYNFRLGLMRAEAVRDHLIDQGVPADRITVQSFGFTKPVVEGSDEAAMAKNRRVEIKVLPPGS